MFMNLNWNRSTLKALSADFQLSVLIILRIIWLNPVIAWCSEVSIAGVVVLLIGDLGKDFLIDGFQIHFFNLCLCTFVINFDLEKSVNLIESIDSCLTLAPTQ